MKTIYLVLLVFACCVNSLVPIIVSGQVALAAPTLLVFSGESNSGGQVLNSEASEVEIAPRPRVQILNNLTFCFEALDIGTNNNLDHFNLSATDFHGWELELANRLYAGTLPDDTIYLVKTGQGGSAISEWADGSTYFAKFKRRMDSAIAKITYQYCKAPDVVLFYTQGINDALANTNIETWKAATIAHFAKIRALYGNISIYVPYFMNGFEPYNTAYDQIVTEVGHITMVISTGAALQDSYHWSYAGMKVVADNLIDAWRNEQLLIKSAKFLR